MYKEIGSIFEIDERKYGLENELHIDSLCQYYVDVAHTYKFVASGREAISLVLQDIDKKKLNRNKIALLPMYTCDTVILPFQKKQWTLIYYDISRNLLTREDEFINLLQKYSPSVVLIHNYYGVDTNKNIRPVLQSKQQSGLIVIEDNTQDLTRSANMFCADYYVASLRKWFPITDGAIVVSKSLCVNSTKKQRDNFVKDKWNALTHKNRYLDNVNEDNYNEMQCIKQQFLKQNSRAESSLYEDDHIYSMSSLSKHLINDIDIKSWMYQRKVNAKIICDNLKDFQLITLPILYSGEETPLYVPIYVRDRNKLQNFMRLHNVFVPILWPIPEQIKEMSNDVKYIYDCMLALPCDGRYKQEDMVYMCDLLKKGMK